MIKKCLKRILALAVITMSMMTVNPIVANAAWKSNAIGWWYTEGNSCAIGWRQINGNWYYFNLDGYMGKCDKINGYFVNSNGIYTNSMTQADALGYVQKQDSNYIGDLGLKYGSTTISIYHDSSIDNLVKEWGISSDSYYEIVLYVNGINERNCTYLVGQNNKNIYKIPLQREATAYQIEHNQKVKNFYYLSNEGGKNIEQQRTTVMTIDKDGNVLITN